MPRWLMDAHFNLVLAAAARLAGQAHRTPVMESQALNQRAGAGVWLKCENFQRTGSFKFRGAYNALASLREVKPTPEVLTYSSGNHAQAMALAGRLLQVKVNVVMPENAPQVKRAAAEAYGARVISYDPEKTTREEIAAALGAERGLPIVPPYDDLTVVAGQATVALEFMAQADDLEFLLVPCGGGGLLSGCAIAARRLSSRCRVIGIEPELADDATRSFRTGTLHTVSNPPTIADGTRTPSLGKLTFPLVRQYVDDMQTVSESAIMEAVQFLLFRLKLLVEPSGALGVAALLSGVVKPSGKTGVILSGGNIDAATLGRIITT